MKINPALSGFDNWLNLVNAEVKTPYQVRYLNFTLPEVWTNPSYPGRNTSVLISPKPGGPYKGNIRVAYTRYDLGLLPSIEVVYDPEIDLFELRRDVVAALGLISLDIELPVNYGPPTDAGERIVTFSAKATSYVYTGTLSVTIVSGVPANARVLEDGTPRLLEDGSYRTLENGA